MNLMQYGSDRLFGTLLVSSAVLAASLAAGVSGAASTAAPPGPVVLATRCVSCHNPEKRSGGIDPTTPSGAEAARVAGPDDPKVNRLVRVVIEGKMPPSGRLPAGEIASLRSWVRGGAVYPPQPLAVPNQADGPLWSMQPVRRPATPSTPFDRL